MQFAGWTTCFESVLAARNGVETGQRSTGSPTLAGEPTGTPELGNIHLLALIYLSSVPTRCYLLFCFSFVINELRIKYKIYNPVQM